MRLAFLLCILCGPAFGVCVPREQLLATLQNKHSESLKAWEVREGGLWEFFGNDGSGTWTLVLTTGNKVACIKGTGKNWVKPPGVLVRL